MGAFPCILTGDPLSRQLREAELIVDHRGVPMNDKNVGVGEGPVAVSEDHSMETAEYVESNGGNAKRTRTGSTAKMPPKIG